MHKAPSLPEIATVPAKSILIRNKSTAWFGAEYNLNLYRGCCHGCIYCDSRSDCYQVGDFDRVRVKERALEVLRNDLSRKVKTGMAATGAMSDPYNPYEEKLEYTRHALELLGAFGFGAGIATKSDLIVRDRDVLLEIAENNPVICKITITTPHDELAAQIEPRAPSSSRRFAAVRQLAEAGLFTGVLLMPVLPYITDDAADITRLVQQAAECGARFVYPAFGVTMRTGQREYCLQQFETIYPERKLAQKYRQKYGNNYHCASPRARHLWEVFCEACQKTGLLYKMQDIIAAYQQGYRTTQLSLFG